MEYYEMTTKTKTFVANIPNEFFLKRAINHYQVIEYKSISKDKFKDKIRNQNCEYRQAVMPCLKNENLYKGELPNYWTIYYLTKIQSSHCGFEYWYSEEEFLDKFIKNEEFDLTYMSEYEMKWFYELMIQDAEIAYDYYERSWYTTLRQRIEEDGYNADKYVQKLTYFANKYSL